MLGIRARFSEFIAVFFTLVLMCASVPGIAQDAVSKDSANSTVSSTNPKTAGKTGAANASAGGQASKTNSSASVQPRAASSATAHAKSTTAVRSSKSRKTATSRRTSRKRTARGQQKIDAQRAEEIQTALIREHYLTGEADGNWNAACEEAMRRYQADHGWQSKTVPDARALISLGLGPSHDHLLNPESAMTTEPTPHAGALAATPQGAVPGEAAPATPVKTTPTPPSDPPVAAPTQGPSTRE